MRRGSATPMIVSLRITTNVETSSSPMTRRLRAEWSVSATTAGGPVSGSPVAGAGAGTGGVSDTGTSGAMGGGSFGTQQ